MVIYEYRSTNSTLGYTTNRNLKLKALQEKVYIEYDKVKGRYGIERNMRVEFNPNKLTP
ncbi:hypothetical protein [Staphylococcus epidermidis]